MQKIVETVKVEVSKLLNNDNSGHGMDHINRVLSLSLDFSKKEKVDEKLVSLIALLHDVDDYKLFGEESAEKLINANRILDSISISKKEKEIILSEIKSIGYSKRLCGITPNTIEGKIVADADMCDALGAVGILRVINYGNKINRPFFNKEIFPSDEEEVKHYLKGNSSTVSFIIENLLQYKNNMLTNVGKEEAKKRHEFIVNFLYQYFNEQNEPEWIKYLDNYLKNNI